MSTLTITPQHVQKLREMTGAGILDCKKALEQSGGDYDKAVQFLREKGKASAASKAGRAAGDGVVCCWISPDGKKGSLVELNCETDFVARTANFQEFARQIAKLAAETGSGNASALLNQKLGTETVEAAVKEKIGTLGENMKVRKAAFLGGAGLLVGNYVHAPYEQSPDCGKLGVLLAVQAGKDAPEVRGLIKELCMQVAAASPKWIAKEDVPADILEKEKAIYLEQCKQSGKPEQAWPKILEGKLKDFYKQFCLLEQAYVRDPKTPVQALVQGAAEKSGGAVDVKSFARLKLGEE